MRKNILTLLLLNSFGLIYSQTNTFPTSGNVGIGTTSPTKLLELSASYGATTLSLQRNNTNSTGSIGNIGFKNSDNYFVASIGALGDGGNTGGELIFRTMTASDKTNSYDVTERMRITNTGYVGIGTDIPSKQLEVVGTILSNRLEINITNTGSLGTHSFQELGETKAFIQWRGTTTSTYPSKFRIGTQSSDDMWFVTSGASRMVINSDGNVGIGTTDPKAKLSVNGTIISSEIKVLADISQYPDFVFSDNYKLRSINEVEKYIEDNNHLPDIPKADEVAEGIALGEMNTKLLQKIEELTLYIIEQNKRIENLENKLEKNGIE